MSDAQWNRSDPLPWVLAATDPDELRAQARALRARVAATSAEGLADLASSVAERVAALPYRAVVLADRREEILRGLDGLQRGAAGAGVVCGRVHEGARVAFVFSPLRAEYPGMGLGLLDRYEAFAAQMAACEAALEPFVEWSLDDILRGRDGTPPFERLDVSQPVLFAISFSLAELWRSFGAHPDVVLGHSVGEIAAAATCGGLSLTDAARVAATWGRSSMRLEGTGTMASLPLSAKEVGRRIEPWRGRLAISCLNAPSWTAVTGETTAVEALLAALGNDGVAGRSMGIEAPGHSAAMAPIHDWFLEELATISPRSGTVPFCSATEGRLVDSAGLDASYWSRNLSQPVLFEAAIHALRKAAYDVFVEIGPRPVLTSAISEAVAAEDGAVAVGTWEQGEASQFPLQLAEAYVLGVEVDWGVMCRNRGAEVPRAALRLSERERSLALRLAELPEKEREPLLLDLVRREVATALGHASPDAVDPGRSFKELGFDSPAAVDLRDRLNRATGLSLSTTLAFDHPTPRAVARRIHLEFEGDGGASPAPVEDAAPDADTERALRDIDELDLAGLVERGLTDVGGSARARRGS